MRLRLGLSALLVILAGCAPSAPSLGPPPELARVVPVVAPPRYAVPTCPLGYEMTTVETDRMDGAPATMRASKLLTFMTVELRPVGSRVELATAMTSQPLTGKHRSYVVPDTAYAPVHLEPDGARWIEREGPTQVFDALGTQGGLEWFFPELPSSGEVGATVEWELTRADALEIMKTEAARGSHPGVQQSLDAALAALKSTPAAPTPAVVPPTHAKVRLDGWTDVHGVRVAELSMTLAEDLDAHMPIDGFGDIHTRAKATVRGSYRVTATGRILSASIEKETIVDMTGPTPGVDQRHTQNASRRMNLVRACDGPTEASLATPLTREERAIHAWGETWVALQQGERDKVLAALDPALVTKHGAPRLWDAFTSLKAQRGDGVIGPPLLVMDKDVTVAGTTVRLVTHGHTPDRATTNTRTPVESAVTLREEGTRWVVESMRVDLVIDPKNLAEISRDRVIVRKGWPPR